MLRQETAESLPEARRKDAFRLLVISQDYAMSVEESREMVSTKFGLSEADVSRIEQEGVERDWPPLCDG